LPVVVCCIVFAKQIFFLCGGADYIEYAYALQGMSILYLIIFTGYPIRIAIRVFLLNREFFFAYCISFLFSLLSAKYLIQQWQLTGVIISLIINQLLMLGYWQMALSRKKFVLWK
jgi:O-antigen/teichoic acid export membrane protein